MSKEILVNVGYHKDTSAEDFLEVMHCLDHAMEACDFKENHLHAKPEVESLHDKIYEAFQVAEFIYNHFYANLDEDDPNYKKLSCPFHTDEEKSSGINMNSGEFYCFKCQNGGDIHKFPDMFKDFIEIYDHQLDDIE
jgi:hypothetical protein